MSRNSVWGGHLEIQAASLRYQTNITIHQFEQANWEVVNFDLGQRMIHLSYHNGEHFASVRPLDANAPRPVPVQHAPAAKKAHAPAKAAAAKPKASAAKASAKAKGPVPTESELQVMIACGLNDVEMVRKNLTAFGGDVAETAQYLSSVMKQMGIKPMPVERTVEEKPAVKPEEPAPAPAPAPAVVPEVIPAAVVAEAAAKEAEHEKTEEEILKEEMEFLKLQEDELALAEQYDYGEGDDDAALAAAIAASMGDASAKAPANDAPARFGDGLTKRERKQEKKIAKAWAPPSAADLSKKGGQPAMSNKQRKRLQAEEKRERRQKKGNDEAAAPAPADDMQPALGIVRI
jgi:hypothetical protein